MTAIRDLQQIILALAKRIEPWVQRASRVGDERLTNWIHFQGLESGKPATIVARQAALNLVLEALITRLRPDGIDLPACYLDELTAAAAADVPAYTVSRLLTTLKRELRKDQIGAAYVALVPQEDRRALGQFWTPVPIAELMAHWAIQRPEDRVLDPAFGSGIFLLTALHRLVALGQSPSLASRQVTGIEISPLAYRMGVANLLLHFPDAQPMLQLGDFLVPRREAVTVVREATIAYEAGMYQPMLPGLELAPHPLKAASGFDAIICNPPYTRHHRLPEAYKATWSAQMEREFGLRLSRLSGLFAYFFVHAARMLKPTGRMAFITPTVVFEAGYSRQVKAFIRRQLRLRAIITFDESLSVFEGVDTAACITLLEGPGTASVQQVRHVYVKEWPGVMPLLAALQVENETAHEWGTVRLITWEELRPHSKWTVITQDNSRFDDNRFVPLGQIARVMRGIATGANDFFVLSDAEVAKWNLSPTYLRPVLTKTREAPGYAFEESDFDRLGREGKKRWLLYLTGPISEGTPEARYIHYGETLGLHTRSLVQTRRRWYEMEQREPAPIYFTYLSRRKSRFIHNRAGVLALNVFLCIYPDQHIAGDETALKALLAVLNSLVSKDALRQVGRTYGGDTIKLEPREMDRLPVLNPLALEEADRILLARLFDKLCAAQSDGAIEEIRRAIDQALEMDILHT